MSGEVYWLIREALGLTRGQLRRLNRAHARREAEQAAAARANLRRAMAHA